MARGVNKVILIGNLGADPETRYMPSGGGVTNTRVATTETWRDKQSGERQERTEWHRVVFFNKLSDIASQYLRKGSRIYVEGSIRTRKWQGQDGQDRYTTEIVASEMQMLDGRSDSVPASTGPESDWDQSPPPPQGQKSGGSKPAATNQAPPDDFDDDIPF